MVGIHPEVLYREADLLELVEKQALTRARQEGMQVHKFGRKNWVLGKDFIAWVIDRKSKS